MSNDDASMAEKLLAQDNNAAIMTLPAEPRLENRGSRHYVAVPAVTTMTDLPALLPSSWSQLQAWLAARELVPGGPPFVRYLVVDMPTRIEVEVAIPTTRALPGDGVVRAGTLPAGRYATLLHTGPYERLADTNAVLQSWAQERGLAWDARPAGNGVAWAARTETYLTDPQTEPNSGRHQAELAYLLADAESGSSADT